MLRSIKMYKLYKIPDYIFQNEIITQVCVCISVCLLWEENSLTLDPNVLSLLRMRTDSVYRLF